MRAHGGGRCPLPPAGGASHCHTFILALQHYSAWVRKMLPVCEMTVNGRFSSLCRRAYAYNGAASVMSSRTKIHNSVPDQTSPKHFDKNAYV